MGNDVATQQQVAETKPKRRVSAEEVVDRVMELIDSRVFQPGDRLREQELADRFNVSRGPVREALRILEAKSIVHIEAMRGATITRLSDEEARDAVDASAVLFGLAARRASERADPDDIADIGARVDLLATMVSDATPPRDFFVQTLRIGSAVVRASASERLGRLIADVRFGAPTYYGPLGFTSVALQAEAVATWRQLLKALKTRDGDVAEKMARKVHDDTLLAALKVVG